MRVVVINTGTEILLGDVVNTHLAFIAREIFPLGLRIDRQLVVEIPDREAAALGIVFEFELAGLQRVAIGLSEDRQQHAGMAAVRQAWDPLPFDGTKPDPQSLPRIKDVMNYLGVRAAVVLAVVVLLAAALVLWMVSR